MQVFEPRQGLFRNADKELDSPARPLFRGRSVPPPLRRHVCEGSGQGRRGNNEQRKSTPSFTFSSLPSFPADQIALKNGAPGFVSSMRSSLVVAVMRTERVIFPFLGSNPKLYRGHDGGVADYSRPGPRGAKPKCAFVFLPEVNAAQASPDP